MHHLLTRMHFGLRAFFRMTHLSSTSAMFLFTCYDVSPETQNMTLSIVSLLVAALSACQRAIY